MLRVCVVLAALVLASGPIEAALPATLNVQKIEDGRYVPARISTRGFVEYKMEEGWSWRGYDRWLPKGRYACGPNIVYRFDPASERWFEVPGRLIVYNPGTPYAYSRRVRLSDD
jgi:hypothetical protein